ncbi:hypothetical protein SteCoe_11225 [Stentor coeruleus]|uniref:Uncharacterized protein n=1 Tax=Stentor coeruleus TaxID=5963 RepID=A0A1R2CDR1_9CILI|nr:hypothetical protein SteCoe_11225 [Stentor coeruleus]
MAYRTSTSLSNKNRIRLGSIDISTARRSSIEPSEVNESQSSYVKSLTLVIFLTEDTTNNSICKYKISKEALEFFTTNDPESFYTLGIYGDKKHILQEINNFFDVKNIQSPRSEGIILYYSIEQKKAILWYKCDNESFILNKQIYINHPLVYGIRILSDLCPIVIACISDIDIKNWCLINPHGIESQAHKVKVAKELKEKIIDIIFLNEVEIHPDEYDLYLSEDSNNIMLFIETLDIKVNRLDDEIKGLIDNFLEEIFEENIFSISFNLSFRRFINNYIQEEDFSKDLSEVQEMLYYKWKYYNDEVRKVMEKYFLDIKKKYKKLKKLFSTRHQNEENKVPQQNLKDLKDKFTNQKNLKSSNRLIKKFMISNKYSKDQVLKFIAKLQEKKNNYVVQLDQIKKEHKSYFTSILIEMLKNINIFIIKIHHSNLSFLTPKNNELCEITLENKIHLTSLKFPYN